jgi:hypothetical protein
LGTNELLFYLLASLIDKSEDSFIILILDLFGSNDKANLREDPSET